MTNKPMGQIVLFNEDVLIVSSSKSILFFSRVLDKWTSKY